MNPQVETWGGLKDGLRTLTQVLGGTLSSWCDESYTQAISFPINCWWFWRIESASKLFSLFVCFSLGLHLAELGPYS